MKLFIKNMVSKSCKMIVAEELEKLGVPYSALELGEVSIEDVISTEQFDILNSSLNKYGMELIIDKRTRLIEKIKNAIIEMVHYSDENIKVNFSDYISKKLNYDYTYLSNIFSEN